VHYEKKVFYIENRGGSEKKGRIVEEQRGLVWIKGELKVFAN